ncbi:lipopolysaccharide biosynthesis protein [Robertmurraya massiliosenegalensis]|uniref:lipopolysaccharide biosynthesis protein n=1 Tax=Robertmurraya massiliosenegalensis TaxID=1287657 RepID=UPI0002F443D4|nr:lipopolysaccharide biosynthesis protein [Robertmurraya massiliosenegalensis]
MNNVNRELKNGIIISAIGKYSYYLVQFVVLGVLARILTPSEFGIVSVINVFLIFFSMLIDMGIGPAIIQNKNLENKQLNGIFSFTIIFSIILSLLFALMSKPIAIFYDDSKLIGASIVMSIALFTSGLNIVPRAILLKQKRFLEANMAQVISSVISGIVGITLALLNFSYYALIFSTIAKNVSMLIIIFLKTNLKILTKIRKEDLIAIYSFSKNQFLFNFINYFSRNLDRLLIGKFLNLKELSYYERAYQLSLYPNQILTNVITPVIQPIMSEYEDKKEIIKKTYLTISRLLAFIGMPLSVFLYFSSEEIIYILFGQQWTGSILTLQILSLSIWIQMILSSTGSIFQSTNRTDLLLLSGIMSTILNIIGIVIGIWLGEIHYVALAILISFSINFIQANYLLMVKVFQVKQYEFYKVLGHPFIISVLVLVPLLALDYFIGNYSIITLMISKAILSLSMFLLGLKITGNIEILGKIFKSRKKDKV